MLSRKDMYMGIDRTIARYSVRGKVRDAVLRWVKRKKEKEKTWMRIYMSKEPEPIRCFSNFETN